MYVDNGGANGPFHHYEASPDAIETSAEELDMRAAGLQSFAKELDARHRATLASVSGEIVDPMSTATRTPLLSGSQIMGYTYVSAGSVRLFGQGVQTFNTTVDKLNEQYRQAQATDFGVAETTHPETATFVQIADAEEARANKVMEARVDLLVALLKKYRDARELLDKDAESAAQRIHEGPTDAAIKELYGAGALPTSVLLAYPDLRLTTTKLPPDLAELSPEEVEDYLREHPEAASVVNGLLTKDGLTDLEQAVVEAQARIDAELLKQGMNKPPGPDALDDIAAAQVRLKLINDHVAKTGVLNDAAHSYTFAWMNEVGSDNLARLSTVVQESIGEKMTGVPKDIEGMVNKYLAPVGDAILNLSNEKYQTVVSTHGAGYAETYRYDFNGDGVLDKNDMPKAIRELMDTRIGEYHGNVRSGGPLNERTGGPTYDTITDLDRFTGWADLMSASTVEGGHGVSVDLAEQAIQAKQDMNAILAGARYQVSQMPTEGEAVWAELTAKLDDSSASDLLSVAARNEDASSELLLDDARRQQILGLNWDDGGGAGDVIRAGTDRNPEDGGGTGYQAQAALKVMTEIASDPKEYMERAANESVSDAVVDLAITWVDTFGQPVTSETTSHYNLGGTDAIGRPLDYSVMLSDVDQQGFLQFIANTGDEDAIRFESASQLYGQQLISAALDGGYERDLDVSAEQALENALGWAGRADGQIHQANIQWALDELGDDQAEQRAELIAQNRSMASTKTAAKTLLSIGSTIGGALFPPAAPFLSVGNALAGPIIDGVLQEHPMPDFEAITEAKASELIVADALDANHRRNYFLAEVALASGRPVPDALLDKEDGTLLSFAEISNKPNGLERLGGVSDGLIDNWNEQHSADADVNRYNEGREETNPPIPPGDRRHGSPDRNWDDDHVAEENLFGDNVPEGYDTSDVNPEDSVEETYPDENHQVDQAPWEERTNDETANDRRERQHRTTDPERLGA